MKQRRLGLPGGSPLIRMAWLIGLLLLSSNAFAKGTRQIKQFDSGWKFHLGDASGAEEVASSDSTWLPVDVPHDWSIHGPVSQSNATAAAGGFFPNGIGWYRKHFYLEKARAGRRTYIVFDGVMANSDVWINGFHLGHRPNGYVSFYYDLTEHLHVGADNVIAVRCDNEHQPASRWYEGAGLYRHVRLISLPGVHLEPWGLSVATSNPESARPTVQIHVGLENQARHTVSPKLGVTITAPDGHAVAHVAANAPEIRPGDRIDQTLQVVIPSPERWDIDHPAMYQANVKLSIGNQALDNDQTSFGIRDAKFDPDKGFILNGRNLKIKGVALHIDGGAVGIAVPASVYEDRLRSLKAIGVNAIRTAHNPPSPEFLDLCDRLGLLVMDEMFDAWTVGKEPYDYHLFFNDWALRDARDTIRRDRNHPSIILWSAGNEIHDTPHPEVAKKVLASLVAAFHEEDPSRPVTQALFRPNASHDYEDGLADMLDVVGQNYRENELLAAHKEKPSRKIIGTENTHDRAVWLAMRDNPPYAGQFLWTGIDYLGEAGQWPLIGNGAGLLDRDDVPRARAYERQSWWSNAPAVHIARRVAPDEKSAVDPGYESLPPKFLQSLYLDWSPHNLEPHEELTEVYSNCEEVELFSNGTSLGRQRISADASPRIWHVPFTPGILHAVGYNGGSKVAQDELRTAGPPARIALRARTASIAEDSESVLIVDASIEDGAGTLVPSTANLLHFSIEGPGKILAVDNASLVDHNSFDGPDRNAFQGKAIVLVRATATRGRITVRATSPGLRRVLPR